MAWHRLPYREPNIIWYLHSTEVNSWIIWLIKCIRAWKIPKEYKWWQLKFGLWNNLCIIISSWQKLRPEWSETETTRQYLPQKRQLIMPAKIILGIKSCWVSVPVYFRDLPIRSLSLFPPSLTQLVSHGPLPASLRAAHSSRAPSAAAAAASAARPVQVHVDDAPPLLGQLGPGLKDDWKSLVILPLFQISEDWVTNKRAMAL